MRLEEIAAKFTIGLAPMYDKDEAKAIFYVVLEHFLNFNRSTYLLKKEQDLPDHQLKEIELVLNELKTGKPVQYCLGETWFYGLRFKVSEAVLIPRPETEELVDWIIEKVNHPISILDIGTGSGCIAIALKKHLTDAEVIGLDISSEALLIAKQNAVLNGVKISFIENDILHYPISTDTTKHSIIVSNPPYITQAEKAEMKENVLANEPHMALFVSDEKPLIFYEAIADFALNKLQPEGLLFFEINEYLAKETTHMLISKGFKNIELRKDMQGKDRMICCKLTTLDDTV